MLDDERDRLLRELVQAVAELRKQVGDLQEAITALLKR